MPEIYISIEEDGSEWLPLQSENILSDRSWHHRAGRFTVDDDYLYFHSRQVMAVMSQVVILRCEHDPMRGKFIYSALSSHFRSIPFGEEIPEYQIIFHKDENRRDDWFKFEEITSLNMKFPVEFKEV